MNKIPDKYMQEMEDLRARLQEAEETLEAIRSGAVDAIVVSQGQHEQVFTLQGAESAYRVILENMSEGAATLTADGMIVYCNARFAEILGRGLEQVMGTRIEQYVVPGDRAILAAMLAQAILDESRGEVRFQDSHLAAVPMYISLNVLPTGQTASVSMVATDLSEQKRHEEVLAAEELARSILDQATEPIVVCDAQGLIIRASHAAHELCGANPILQPFHKVFPLRPAERQDPLDLRGPIDVNRLLCLGEVLSGRVCRNLEMVFAREGGRTFDLLVSAGPLVNRQNQAVGCVIGLMDMTEHKRAAEALATRTEELATTVEELELIQEEMRTTNDELVAAQDSLEAQRQRYQDLFESAPDGYVVTDAHGIIREANQAAGMLLQEKQTDLVGKPLLLFVPPALQEDYQRMLEELAATGGIHQWDAQLQTRQRTRIDAAVTVAVVRDEGGKLESLRWLLRDVTERKRTEQALQESEERFRVTQELSPDGFTILRPVRDDQGRIVDFVWVYENAAIARMNGTDPKAVVGRRVLELLPSHGQSPFHEAYRQVAETGEPRVLEALYHADSILTPTWFRVAVVRIGGDIAILAQDVTERRRQEQQLKDLNETLERRVAERTGEVHHRAAQLRRLASELTQTEQRERRRLAEILHDHIQQLLVGAKFGVMIARNRYKDDEQRQSLRQVDELLDQCIQASRTLTVELSPPVLYSGGLSQALQWLASWMQEKHGLVVEVQADDRANPQAEDIRVLLFQSVRELLFNVVKHANIKQAAVQVGPLDGERVRVVVSDQGAGFDPRQRQIRGGGFGLFSIQERLDLLGGRMEVESAPGQGTQVTLVAPLRLAGADKDGQAEPVSVSLAARPATNLDRRVQSAAGAGAIRVLLADDHAIVRDGLARLLQTEPDMEVVGQVSDGRMAVERARQLKPDVVLMDVAMPHLGGINATRQILAELPDTCVIGLSMYAEPGMADEMRQAGAVQYLTKSGPPEDLIAAIRACRQARDAAARPPE